MTATFLLFVALLLMGIGSYLIVSKELKRLEALGKPKPIDSVSFDTWARATLFPEDYEATTKAYARISLECQFLESMYLKYGRDTKAFNITTADLETIRTLASMRHNDR